MLQERRSKLVESLELMSDAEPAAAEPPAAARAGADLRAARERLGLSLETVAFDLRIRQPHLEALEEGRISVLPGNAYALAFVRTYANALGLDAEEMVRRFRAEAAEFNRHTELVFPVPMPERGLPAGAVVLVGLVLTIGAYAGWYRLSGEGRLPAETETAVPEHLTPLAQQALPPRSGGSSPDDADAVPDAPSPAPGTVARPGMLARAKPTPDTSAPATPGAAGPETPEPEGLGQSPGMVAAQTVQATGAAPEPASPAPPVASISPTSAAAAQIQSRPDDGRTQPSPDAPRIVLRASADAWLSVKERGGGLLLNRTLKAGETWPVPPRRDLLLTTGNAGGTEILVDGATTPSLGGSGAVRRDLALDPDQIKDGKLAAAIMPQSASTRPRQ